MASQIRTIGFRNSLYVGEIDPSLHLLDRPQGIGLMLDDRFLMCLSNWISDGTGSSSLPSGPTLIIFPTQEMFYCEDYPKLGKLTKNWCFISNQFAFYGNGDSKILAVLHLTGNLISKVRSADPQRFECLEQINYHSQDNKWEQIQRIIGSSLHQNFRNLDIFIQTNFSDKINRQGMEYFIKNRNRSNQSFYAITSNDQGLAFTIKYTRAYPEVVLLGYYNQITPTRNMNFGRQYKTDAFSSVDILQGNFSTQQLFNFKFLSERPAASSHTSRNFFRQTTIFCNKFTSFREIDSLYQTFSSASDKYTKSINHKYGQKIIQGNQLNARQEPIREQQPYREVRQKPKFNREYNLQEAKANIQMEIARKKGSWYNFQTGIFKTSPSKYAASKESKYYKQEVASDHITQRVFNQTQRKKSPASTSRRYVYAQQSQISQKVRVPQDIKIRPRLNSPVRVTLPIYKQNRSIIEDNIHEFTLYPKTQTAEDQLLSASPVYNFPSRDRIDKLRQLQHELLMRRQIENMQTNKIQNQIYQYDRHALSHDEIWRRHVPDPMLGIQPTSYQLAKRQPNIQLASLNKKPRAYRKYVNFDYTGQTKELERVKTPSTSPLAYRKPVKMAPSSPIVRLNADSEVRNREKQNTENPRKTVLNATARRIYNYVE